MSTLDATGTLDSECVARLLKKAKDAETTIHVVTTLGNILKLFKEEILVPYKNNRSGNFSAQRTKEMASNFNPYGFGQITASFYGGRLELVDAHHRLYTLEYMNDVLVTFGTFTSEEVSLKIVPTSKRLSTYQTLNAGKAHAGADKVGNPDLAIGSILNDILIEAGITGEFKKGHKQNLADLVLAYEECGPNFEIEDFFAKRSTVNSLLNTAKDRRSFSVKDITIKRAAYFAQKYQSIVNFAQQEDAKSEVISLVNSPGFFLLVGADCLTNGNFAGGFSTLPNKKILKKISGHKFPKIKEQTRALARRNRRELNLIELKKSVQ